MKFNRLSFFAALFMTLAITVIVIAFDYSKTFDVDKVNADLLFIISILLIFLINYFGVGFLFRTYGRRQIKKIAVDLPKDFFENSENVGFKELSEKLTQNVSEIDMIKEMEAYRKEYIGNVSHELKTPLFSIQGYIETLRDGGVENLNIRDKYLERIGISVERLINIVNDLDMINRFESGEIKLNISKFDINLLVKETFDMLDLEAQSRNAILSLNTSAPQVFVNADKQKISQVLINLISNAIHYANRQQAQIIVKTTVLKNKVLIEVSDNGMGIKPEALPRIFERFFRVESSRSRREGGSGLGLAIVKHILEAHNENISVESVYLEGTNFSFMLEKG
ncbi:GHKL domain-containing protein [Chryseobacterium taklimakanense]|uniref:sensor histidine kinase n=1 Tax=Chryseobacterium taklimakanense TaxID=536441 RepID=UPI000F5EF49A|nr:ATP-binding protein [Chryseobacterium taklimakanense]AZI23313.1 GHKL domain-containing protein [Chryseobacterium taklimakanense]MCG7280328.1 ATP-binding protein [Chryseobacterium taklimakanense]